MRATRAPPSECCSLLSLLFRDARRGGDIGRRHDEWKLLRNQPLTCGRNSHHADDARGGHHRRIGACGNREKNRAAVRTIPLAAGVLEPLPTAVIDFALELVEAFLLPGGSRRHAYAVGEIFELDGEI